MHGCRFGIALLLASWCADTAQARSYGPWKIPSRPVQCFGYGFGAGYHAPLVKARSCQPPHVARHTVVPTCPPAGAAASGYSCPTYGVSSAGHCCNGMCGSGSARPTYPPPVPHHPTPHRPVTQPTPALVPGVKIFSPHADPVERMAPEMQQTLLPQAVPPSLPMAAPRSQASRQERSLPQAGAAGSANGVFPGPPMPTADTAGEPSV